MSPILWKLSKSCTNCMGFRKRLSKTWPLLVWKLPPQFKCSLFQSWWRWDTFSLVLQQCILQSFQFHECSFSAKGSLSLCTYWLWKNCCIPLTSSLSSEDPSQAWIQGSDSGSNQRISQTGQGWHFFKKSLKSIFSNLNWVLWFELIFFPRMIFSIPKQNFP